MPFAVESLCASAVCVTSMSVCGTFQLRRIEISALATWVWIHSKYFYAIWEEEDFPHMDVDGMQMVLEQSDSTANGIWVYMPRCKALDNRQ